MRHLIIGAGHMGMLHGRILKELGDVVIFIDFAERNRIEDFIYSHKKWDSVFVCTPPVTHEKIINEISLLKSPPPLFIEKPPTVKDQKIDYPNLSMVACNWRFCQCIQEAKEIFCAYPTEKRKAEWDLIHFVDMFWERYGKPEKFSRKSPENIKAASIHLVRGKKLFSAAIQYNFPFVSTSIKIKNGSWKAIHSSNPCGMFHEQIKSWRFQLRSFQEINPLRIAQERMNWLLRTF